MKNKIENIYKWQTSFYDFFRKYYLFGRDDTIFSLNLKNQNVLEIGSGTGRNLILLAKLYPSCQFYGIDLSPSMLKYAKSRIHKEKLSHCISLHFGNAGEIDTFKQINNSEKMDKILFFYSLSMMDNPVNALKNSLSFLSKKGELYIVDFSSHNQMPKLFSAIHKKWLRLFHVEYKKEVFDYLKTLTEENMGNLEYFSSIGNYYEVLKFRKN